MTCYQCTEYRAGGSHFDTAFCEAGRTGFPFVGDKCEAFVYEPGTDDEETDGT